MGGKIGVEIGAIIRISLPTFKFSLVTKYFITDYTLSFLPSLKLTRLQNIAPGSPYNSNAFNLRCIFHQVYIYIYMIQKCIKGNNITSDFVHRLCKTIDMETFLQGTNISP